MKTAILSDVYDEHPDSMRISSMPAEQLATAQARFWTLGFVNY
jgi:hypothetical protein